MNPVNELKHYKIKIIYHITHMNHNGYCSGAEAECTNDAYSESGLCETRLLDISENLR
jgi:hypothetical protein